MIVVGGMTVIINRNSTNIFIFTFTVMLCFSDSINDALQNATMLFCSSLCLDLQT